MDCKTARRLMDSCRPSEDDWQAPELAGVSAHLEECSDCLMQFRSRQAFDERVAPAMQSVPVPAGLSDRIFTRLDRARVWRRRRVFATWSAAAAAAVLIAVGVTFWHGTATGPIEVAKDPKSLGEWAVAAVEAHDDGINIPAPTKTIAWKHRPEVEAWVRKQLRSDVALPTKWLSSSLQAIWKSAISGRPVAVFQFADSRGSADVFVFPHSQFDVGNASQVAQPIYTTRGFIVVAWTEQDTTYVAVLRNWSEPDVKRFIGQKGGIT